MSYVTRTRRPRRTTIPLPTTIDGRNVISYHALPISRVGIDRVPVVVRPTGRQCIAQLPEQIRRIACRRASHLLPRYLGSAVIGSRPI